MKGARLSPGVAVCVVAVLAALAGTARAANGWVSCGSIPARITFNIETRGLGCTAARALVPRLQRFSKVKTIVPSREFSYVVPNGWLCYYEGTQSKKAQDDELSSFDCRTTEGAGAGSVAPEIRWTDATGVKPVELLPVSQR